MDQTEQKSQDNDWSLVQRHLSGDLSGFHELFDKHKRNVINLAYQFVHSREAAEDIAQEVFIKIYEKRVALDPKAKFTTWLYRVTVNAALDDLRRRKKFKFSLDAPRNEEGQGTFLERLAGDERSPEAAAADEEVRRLVRGEITKLPEKLRLPLILYQFEDLPYADIAKIIGISEKAVERRLYRAREKLKEALSKYKIY